MYIYSLINPIDNKVIYIGQTKENINHRLKGHYWKLNEVKRGKRNWTPLFKFLNSILPVKVKISLIKEIDTNVNLANPDFYEEFYIKKYRKENPDLLNETDGGIGGNTIKNKSKEEQIAIGQKISKKLKGKPKPAGFGEHLSYIRSGKSNPGAKPLNPKIGAYINNKLVKIFDYGCEINQFLNNKYAYGNIYKLISSGTPHYGYVWKYIK